MKRLFLILTLLLTGLGAAAQQMNDCVYLKNGSIIKGVIIEQIPGESLKIQTPGGSIFVYRMDEVEKITKEAQAANPVAPGNAYTQWQTPSVSPYSYLTLNGLHQVWDTRNKVIEDRKLAELLGPQDYQEYLRNKQARSNSMAIMITGEIVSLLSTVFAVSYLAGIVKSPYLNGILVPVSGISTLAFLYGIHGDYYYRSKSQGILDRYNFRMGREVSQQTARTRPSDRKLTLMVEPGIGFMYADWLSSSPDYRSYFESLGIDLYNKAGFSLPLMVSAEYRPWEDKAFFFGGGIGAEYSNSGFGGYHSSMTMDLSARMSSYGAEAFVGLWTLGNKGPYIYGKAGAGLGKFSIKNLKAKVKDNDGNLLAEQEVEYNVTSDWRFRPFIELGIGSSTRWGVRYSPIIGDNDNYFNAWQLVVTIPVFNILTY